MPEKNLNVADLLMRLSCSVEKEFEKQSGSTSNEQRKLLIDIVSNCLQRAIINLGKEYL